MEIILAVLGLTGSFYFAGAEAAYTAFNRIRLDVWKKQHKRFISAALYFHEKPEDFFSTILIGNNFSNILYTTFATIFLIHYFGEAVSWFLVTFVVLFFGEIFPKTIFRSAADLFILPVLFLAKIIFFLFKPAIFIINHLLEIFLKLFHIRHSAVMDYFSRDELELLLHTGFSEKAVDTDEQKYISNVLDFSASPVREAMIPRTEIKAAADDIDYEHLLELMIREKASYVMLYHETQDNITGVVFCKEMLRQKKSVAELVRPVYLVPENKSCADLLREFQQKNISIALVVDEFGGTAGVVTMDELIEQVFGEFYAPDEAIPQLRALNDHTWLVDGRAETDLLEEKLNIHFGEGDFETLAGFLLDHAGKIPNEGERFSFHNFRVEITRASPKKILQVKIIKNLVH